MPSFSVILVEPKYEGNVGSVARVMKNFGFNELMLVNPPPLDKKARAMSMHGRDVLENAKIFGSLNDAREEIDFLVATSSVIGADKNQLRTPVFPEYLHKTASLKGRVGLVFGREDYGLYNTEIKLCDLLVSIPANETYPTLNLSHSVAIILYEITKPGFIEKKTNLKKFWKADKIEKKILLEKFDELVDLAHRREQDANLAKKTFRQLTGRSFISGRESSTLIGLFKRATSKIKEK